MAGYKTLDSNLRLIEYISVVLLVNISAKVFCFFIMSLFDPATFLIDFVSAEILYLVYKTSIEHSYITRDLSKSDNILLKYDIVKK